MREISFILFPQYNILFPQHTILFPQHIILFPQYIINTNKLSPSTEATYPMRPDFKCTDIVKY